MPSGTWIEVREQTTCEAMRDDYCLGRYGFTIKDDGTFIAGPSPQGSQVQGRTKPQELRRLGKLMSQLSPILARGERTCEPGGLPGIKDQVDVTFAGGSVVRAYDSGGLVGKICHVGAWEDVHRLHDYLHKLMTRYYPLPFPAH